MSKYDTVSGGKRKRNTTINSLMGDGWGKGEGR
jgi:hypothetical protein